MSRRNIVLLTILSLAIMPEAILADEIEQTGWGDLTVNITDIKNSKGVIRMALFDTEESYRRSGDEGLGAFRSVVSKISPDGSIQVTFKNIPTGEYAIKLYQDEDNSGTLKRDWHDRPQEDFAFSNNIDAAKDMPEFKQVKFDFDETHESQTLKMQRVTSK